MFLMVGAREPYITPPFDRHPENTLELLTCESVQFAHA
jgi:hypothetical protein